MKEQNYKKLYEKLVRAGYDISYKNIAKLSDNGKYLAVGGADEISGALVLKLK